MDAKPDSPSSVHSPEVAASGGAAGTLAEAAAVLEPLRERLRAVIRGRDDVIDLVVIAILADGHVLLEDYPGSGKTTLARALGESITDSGEAMAAFRRIQFTPDLLPSDITGTSVFDVERNRFDFRPGPLFAHIVLADEINRTSPKVQAAMLEAMAEKQVTVDNTTHPLDPLFFVIATQNPVDLAGTYPLPTPQLDRFLFKIAMTHIPRDAELEVLDQYPSPSLALAGSLATVSSQAVLRARAAIREQVALDAAIKEALVDLARAVRADDRVLQGTSTRSLVLALPALQARAVIEGRDFVSPDDVAHLAPVIFGHRVECVGGAEVVPQVLSEHVGQTVDALAKRNLRGR